MRTPGLLRSFGHVFGSGLANELLDRLFPAPPTWSERFLKGFSESLLAALPYVVERMAPPDPKPAEAAPPPPVVPPFWVPPPPCKILGQFTCPKCGGHTWGWMGEQGRDENGTHLRRCHGPCYFTWKATEDHLYFAPPTVDDQKRSEPQTCAPPPRWSLEDEIQVAISKEWPGETPPPIDALRKDLASLRKALGECDPRSGAGTTLIGRAVKFIRAADKLGSEGALFKAVGDRRRDDETTVQAAGRLLAEADAYIAKQAEKIRGLVADNEFKVNCGEFSVTLSPEVADVWGMRPGRLAVVLNDGKWSVRNGSALEPIEWNQAYFLLEEIEHGREVGKPEPANSQIGDGRPCDKCRAPAGKQCRLSCSNYFARVPVVGGESRVPIEAAVVAAQEAAKRSVVGSKVPLHESVEVAAFVDDAEKEKLERERRSDEDSRRWQEYVRKVDAEKARDAADNQAKIETEMAQNAAGGVA